MDTNEKKKRIRELIKSGQRRRFSLPIEGVEYRPAVVGECSIPMHKCIVCEDDKPQSEFGEGDSKYCIHHDCDELWGEVEREIRIATAPK